MEIPAGTICDVCGRSLLNKNGGLVEGVAFYRDGDSNYRDMCAACQIAFPKIYEDYAKDARSCDHALRRT